MVSLTDNWTGEEEAAEAKAKAEKLSDTVTWDAQKKWKEGDDDAVLVGVLIEAKIVSGNFGPTTVLNVEDDDGVVWTVWAGSKVFTDALKAEAPALGKKVRLTYAGKQQPKKAGGYAFHMWLVTAQDRDDDLWLNMRLEEPRNEPVAAAADGMEDPF